MVPKPVNEPGQSFQPGSPERDALKQRLSDLTSAEIEIPLLIGGKEVRTGNTSTVVMPHRHEHVLATWHKAGKKEVKRPSMRLRRHIASGRPGSLRIVPRYFCERPNCWPQDVDDC